MNPLYRILKSLKTEDELLTLLDITFTHKEKKMMLERWQIFEACKEGFTQREVSKIVDCSIVTATRGSKTYKLNQEQIDYYLNLIRRKGESMIPELALDEFTNEN